ncbi:MAG: glutamate 5-kinase, partial [Ruminococcaceae bacterium]|nr:glutamate 5-kinase [Oscillospiraceae bacterium]
MNRFSESEIIVIKVGTSTLTHKSGNLNIRRFESLCKVISDLQNSGKKIVLVSSGAVGVGMGKLGLSKRPTETEKKQALAAVGQCELMFMYDKVFGEYNRNIAQVLLTKD